jgi:hypothetical protein
MTKFTPEREVFLMLQKMSEINTFSHSSGFAWSKNQKSTTLYAAGGVDLSSENGMNYKTRFRLVKLLTGQYFNDLKGEVHYVNNQTYLRYEKPVPEILGVKLMDHQWVEFDYGELSGWGNIIVGADFPIKTFLTDGELSDTFVLELREMISNSDIFLSSFNNITELVNGVNTRPIDVRFDRDALYTFLLDVIRVKYSREPSDTERVEIKLLSDKLSKFKIKFWIGIKDHLLYRVHVIGGVTDEDSGLFISMDNKIEFSDFNKQIGAYKVKQSVYFKDIFSKHRESLLGASRSKIHGSKNIVSESTIIAKLPRQTIEVNNDRDKDGLSNILEKFYGTNPDNPDTDGDGVMDGVEVNKALNPNGKGSLFGFGL